MPTLRRVIMVVVVPSPRLSSTTNVTRARHEALAALFVVRTGPHRVGCLLFHGQWPGPPTLWSLARGAFYCCGRGAAAAFKNSAADRSDVASPRLAAVSFVLMAAAAPASILACVPGNRRARWRSAIGRPWHGVATHKLAIKITSNCGYRRLWAWSLAISSRCFTKTVRPLAYGAGSCCCRSRPQCSGGGVHPASGVGPIWGCCHALIGERSYGIYLWTCRSASCHKRLAPAAGGRRSARLIFCCRPSWLLLENQSDATLIGCSGSSVDMNAHRSAERPARRLDA